MTPRKALRAARQLHERLADGEVATEDRQRVAREIAGLLFAAESAMPMTNKCRLLFMRLRTDAESRNGVNDSDGVPNRPEIWDHYEEIERDCTDPEEPPG